MSRRRIKSTHLESTNNNTSYCNFSNAMNHENIHASKRQRNLQSIILFPVWIVLITLMLATPCRALNPPNIIPKPKENNIVLEKGQQLQLTCHGDEPLKWTSSNTDDFHLDQRVNITEFKTDAMPRPYSSTLTLTNIIYTDAGFFTCSYVGHDPINSEDETTEDFVSVHVEDEEHLLIEPKLSVVHAFTGVDVLLECRTSWPEANVSIQIFNASNSEEIPINSTVNYSRLKGLTLRSVKPSYNGKYICTATYQDSFPQTVETKEFEIVVIGSIDPSPPAGIPIYPPRMSVSDMGLIKVGETFTVRCDAAQDQQIFYTLPLEFPPSISQAVRDGRAELVEDSGPRTPTRKTWYHKLIVKNARKEDAGNYTCTVKPVKPPLKSKSQYREVKIFEPEESLLEVNTAVENITVKEYQTATWVINITSFPINFDYIWKNPKGNVLNIPNRGGKYKITNASRDGEYILEVAVATLVDTGNYPFTVQIPGLEPKVLNLHLTVIAPPKVEISPKGSQINCKSQSTCELRCKVTAYPAAEIKWTVQTCNSSESCTTSVEVAETRRKQVNYLENVSVLEFIPTQRGVYTCSAKNKINKTTDTKQIRVVDSDFPGNGSIGIIVQPEEVVEGENVRLICAVSKLEHENANITWYQLFGDTSKLISSATMKTEETQWSRRKILELDNIQQSASGTYKCSTGGIDVEDAIKHVDVLSILMPQLKDTNLNNSKVDLTLGDSMNLTCNPLGRPKPNITWTWDDHAISEWPKELKYDFSEDNSLLVLKYVPQDAQGRFKCITQNRHGSATAYRDVIVTGIRTFSNDAIIIIVVLFVISIIIGAILARYKYKQGELNRFLKEISQKDFYDGAVDNINPELSVADQAYLLPFDLSWEFPKDRLKLGIQLGSGAFGRVVKADAVGILDTEPRTTVAVKMVKPNADESHFKALMSELKIMVHLGKHINVVNLLGACTKNLAKKKELFVIVEYCKYGSLLSYMHRNKRTFINQLDPARGIIDPNIDQPINRNSEQSQEQRIRYAQLTFTFTDTGNSRKPASNGYRTLEEFKQPNDEDPSGSMFHAIELRSRHSDGDYLTPIRNSTEHYVPESQVESVCTGVSYLSNGPTIVATDGTTNHRSSCGSQWPDHYRGDYQARDVQPIKTTDLLCWAFQIARGMDYLASRKVLHGDLAARNVLLAENNVVKICDFGLAKEMYKDYKYKKKSEGVLLPVKWMAIESIYYGLFSTQSDCWSFGVVLWELFTLGKTPYPGMEADERFYKRISEGYRMEKPPLAPSCVYDIMLECWAQEPTERPSFSALVDRIGDMMSEGLRNHYVDLNAEYMRINHTYLSGRPDYLLQMGRTEFASNSTRETPERKYQNVPEEVDSSGYLKPIPFNTLSPPPTSPQYQNIDTNLHEPTVLAINNGYQFINRQPNSTAETNGQPEPHQSNDTSMVKLQIQYSPDIKDLYGLREDSTSPERNSMTEETLNDNHVNIVMGIDGIRGVDNLNYVSNHTLINKLQTTSSPVEPNKLSNGTGNANDSNSRRHKRQKNDSGLGSIDSTHFDHHKYNSHEGQHQYNEFGHLQDSNGYVTHHNITSLS